MDLYLIRHAWAGHYGDPEWPDDFQRPLTDKGKERFARMVATLVDREFDPKIVATSPLVRCRQTAEIVAEGLPQRPPVVVLEELEPGSDLQGLLAWTVKEAAGQRDVAWVGHNPDVEDMTAALVGQPGAAVRFAKGAVAAVRFDGPPAAARGELRWLVTAKLLGC